jgi:ATP-dependent DNA ligase
MTLPTLFARTSTGAVQQWTIQVEGSAYRTVHGQVDGKLQTTEWMICFPKNQNRSNATTAEEQALKEASSIWQKKKDSGYFENVSDIDIELFTEPMLADPFNKREKDIKYPVYSQPKLDGIRCIARPDGLWTRKGKRHLGVPHIEEALKSFFQTGTSLLLDGELYCDKFSDDFNAICSIVRKEKLSDEDIIKSRENLQFWVYDVIEPQPFTRRNARLAMLESTTFAANPYIKFVQSNLCFDREQLDDQYATYLEQGYEGQIIRDCSGLYEHKRTKNLLKRKEFMTEEFEILDILEGEGNKTGIASSALFKTVEGKFFNSNIKGNRAFCKDLWVNRERYIGQMGTVQFFGYTPGESIPRFPYLIEVRNYE